MFIDFFYLLKSYKVHVTMDEWLLLMEALNGGLCGGSFTDFYYLCRAVLVKSETEFDRFDQVFAEYFKSLEAEGGIPPEILGWLDGSHVKDKENIGKNIDAEYRDLRDIQKAFERRRKDQDSRHDGGSYYIGEGGNSFLGSGGFAGKGIRVGDSGRYRTALQVARTREFADFRDDKIIQTRDFQMAFRKLRQLSSNEDVLKTELDVDGTVHETCDNGGMLKLKWDKPRKNAVKLIVLFDSDGSMAAYRQLCNTLFQAVNRSNHFSDLRFFYFHNCVYEHVYTTPHCREEEQVDLNWIFQNLKDYRVIFVGDGTMAPSELLEADANGIFGRHNKRPGLVYLQQFRSRYRHCIWLNPMPQGWWHNVFGHHTLVRIEETIPMYELSIRGLESGLKKLLVTR